MAGLAVRCWSKSSALINCLTLTLQVLNLLLYKSTHPFLRLVPALLFGFVFLGLIQFVVAFYLAAYAQLVYDYSSPAVVAMGGLAVLWVSVLFALWWTFFWAGFSVWGHRLAAVVGLLYATLGLLNLITLAATPGNGAASVLSLLWIALGLVIAAASYFWLKLTKVASVSPQPCCSLRNVVVGFGVFALLFCTALSLGYVIQNAVVAAETSRFPPQGKLFTFPYKSYTLTMHLNCQGPSSPSPTIICEHGGGSNSVSYQATADYLIQQGRRVCRYDRLGYGWTPTWIQYLPDSVIESGFILVELLHAAGESGPFVCIGHSAGAAACVSFALAAAPRNISVVGIGSYDGFPDLIRGGTKLLRWLAQQLS